MMPTINSFNTEKGNPVATGPDPSQRATRVSPTPRGSKVIPILAAARAFMGVGLLVAPRFLCTLMRFNPQAAASSTILTRMSGSREIGLGVATWLVYSRYTRAASGDATTAATGLLYHVLIWGNIFVDGCDALGSLVAFLTSPEEAATGAMLAPSGLFAAILGLVGLMGVH